jgi:hypothetical protein
MACQRLRAHGPRVNFSEVHKAREKRAEAIWEFWMRPALTALAYSSRAKSKGMPSRALMDGVMTLVASEMPLRFSAAACISVSLCQRSDCGC